MITRGSSPRGGTEGGSGGKLPVSSIGSNMYPIVDGLDTLYVPYETTLAFTDPGMADIERVIIQIHGGGRDLNSYELVKGNVEDEGVDGHTLVVGPQWLHEVDVQAWGLDDVLYWEAGQYSLGGLSDDTVANPRPFTYGAYDVLHDLLATIEAACPNLKVVVISGHSGGGKYASRFAVATDLEGDYPGINFIYLSGNAGNHVYLDDKRWDGDSFETPSAPEIAACPTYDNWPYGISNLATYGVNPATAKANYQIKNVYRYVGDQDTDPPDDLGCASQMMGVNRYQLHLLYELHIADTYGAYPHSHHSAVVAGMGHQPNVFYAIPEVIEILCYRFQPPLAANSYLWDSIAEYAKSTAKNADDIIAILQPAAAGWNVLTSIDGATTTINSNGQAYTTVADSPLGGVARVMAADPNDCEDSPSDSTFDAALRLQAGVIYEALIKGDASMTAGTFFGVATGNVWTVLGARNNLTMCRIDGTYLYSNPGVLASGDYFTYIRYIDASKQKMSINGGAVEDTDSHSSSLADNGPFTMGSYGSNNEWIGSLALLVVWKPSAEPSYDDEGWNGLYHTVKPNL